MMDLILVGLVAFILVYALVKIFDSKKAYTQKLYDEMRSCQSKNLGELSEKAGIEPERLEKILDSWAEREWVIKVNTQKNKDKNYVWYFMTRDGTIEIPHAFKLKT
jgi:hypothetical protein